LRSPEFRDEGFVDYVGVPLITKGTVAGVLEIYNRHALEPDREWMEFLKTLAGQTAIAIENIRLFEDLQSSNMQLHQAYDATIEGWAHALEMRDMETEGHSRRVVDTTLKLARKLGIKERELIHIRRGTLLHDIGKMGVPDAILQKPGNLNASEWQIMQQHPVYAYKWLSQISYLKPALVIPYCHHEKWDGTGYPRGLEGEEIPLAARIFAVVDVWDALQSDRPYRKAWADDKVIRYMETERNKHFDPKVVDTFLGMLASGELQPWA
jgi:HD-GYP domain-containing protein (c-di-GMP phosphodiesterase class II)